MASGASPVTAKKTSSNLLGIPNIKAMKLRQFHSPARSGIGLPSPQATSFLVYSTDEHAGLGNKLELTVPKAGGGTEIWCTKDHKFNAKSWGPDYNKQSLSYGDINALAGDYYGLDKPISGEIEENPSDDVMKVRFMEAFDLLFKNPDSVDESHAILQADFHIEGEPLKKWKGKLPPGKQTSWVYATQMEDGYDQIQAFDAITENRYWNGKAYPKYSDILANNFDHFGEDALNVYAIGHELALEVAANAGKAKDATQLMRAYAMNAYAEHFLEDSFSSGHIRTPRRMLHSSYGNFFWDLCANLQHDEDSALGIRVHTRADPDVHWTCFGDDYLNDDKGTETKTKCLDALKASVQEIWEAYDSQKYSTDHGSYQGIRLAPVADKEPDSDTPAPLFIVKDNNIWQRNWSWDDAARRNWDISNYTAYSELFGWSAATTYAEAKTCGWWTYEMRMDVKGNGN